MTAIWKFSLPVSEVTDEIEFDMPVGARVLSAGNQDEQLCIWALVTPSDKTEKVRFYVVGTGNPLPDDLNPGYVVETVQFMGGKFVVHVFER